MAGLHLVPNPAVLLVQTGLFVANVIVVKKLMLEPYLRVRAKRFSATEGSLDFAATTTETNEKLTKELELKLMSAQAEIKRDAQLLIDKANAEREVLLKSAEGKARESLGQVEAMVKKELDEERQKLPKIVEELVPVLYKQIMD
jgi:F0F1-type ATP synthase membrane subunit b/b'